MFKEGMLELFEGRSPISEIFGISNRLFLEIKDD